MNTRARVAQAALMVAAASSLFACSPEQKDAKPANDATSSSVSDIIGGFDAFGPQLNAIGTVGTVNAAGKYQFFCSATLIGPKTVLTAKHCAIVMGAPPLGPMKLVNLIPIYFAVGPDSKAPLQLVEAIAADTSPLGEGGMVGLGNDVAVYHLKQAVEGVTPMKVGQSLRPEQIGSRFASIGFGSQDNREDISGRLAATRRAGAGTLRALEGKAFELMFGTWEAFRQSMVEEYGEEIVKEYEELIRSWYDDTVLFKDYESWVGYAPGDAQSCHGDSGGPLVGRVAVDTDPQGAVVSERQIFGVVSGGWHSSQLTCDYGTFYASIGPKTQELITKAFEYTDPCEGFDSQGVCSGTVATRCSGKWEGDRRLLTFDCADLDQACGVNAKGQVACIDPNEPVDGGSPTDPVDGGGGPTDPVDGGEGGGGGGEADAGAPNADEIIQLIDNAAWRHHRLDPK